MNGEEKDDRDRKIEAVIRASRELRLAGSGEKRARAALRLFAAIDSLDGCPSTESGAFE